MSKGHSILRVMVDALRTIESPEDRFNAAMNFVAMMSVIPMWKDAFNPDMFMSSVMGHPVTVTVIPQTSVKKSEKKFSFDAKDDATAVDALLYHSGHSNLKTYKVDLE